MKRLIFASFCLPVLCLSALTFAQTSIFSDFLSAGQLQSGSQSLVPAVESNSAAAESELVANYVRPAVSSQMDKPLADEIAFELFFVRVITLEKKAVEAETRGESAKLWRNYLLQQGFTDDEVNIIRRTAQEFAAEIVPLHTKALQVIKEGRAALARGEKRHQPPPTAELEVLQKQRAALALRYRDRLQNRLGREAVEKTRLLMRKDDANGTPRVAPAELPSREERLEMFRQQRRSAPENSKGGNDNE